jgi:hypothetical protein
MRRFLQKLASGVIRPQPNLHPFAESIYPAQLHASSESLGRASEITLVSSRRDQSTSQPPQAETFSVARAPQMEAQRWPSTTKVSALPETVSTHGQNYFRPLLPVREIQGSQDAAVISPLHRQTDGTSSSTPESRSQRMHDDERDSDASPKFQVRTTHPEHEETRTTKQVSPLLPLFDAQSLALRKPAAIAAQFAPRAQQETPSGDDIRINIGRIEVIAVPLSAPQAMPAPTRKGMSLDEYLSRRNGRTG